MTCITELAPGQPGHAAPALSSVAALVASCGLCDSCTIYTRRATGQMAWAARARQAPGGSGILEAGTSLSDAQLEAALAGGGLQAMLGRNACLVLPLLRDARAVGALSLARSDQRGGFDARERAVADEMAVHVAAVLDVALGVDAGIAAAAEMELRSLVTAIQLRVQNMRRRGDPQSKAWLRGELEKVHGQVRRLAALVNGLQMAADAPAWRNEQRREQVDLTAVARDAASDVQATLRHHGSSIELEGDAVIGHWCAADVRVLLVRLLDTAVRSAPGVSWRAVVRGDGPDATVQLEATRARLPDEAQLAFTASIAQAAGASLEVQRHGVDGTLYLLRLPLKIDVAPQS